MAVYAIGDLQGCYDEFRALLDELGFEPRRDRLWLTGDLVNRGPASLATLRHVKVLGAAVSVVLGNHDLHLLAAALDPKHLRRSDTLDEVLAAPDRDELLAWLARLPLVHDDRALGWAMVHAGLPPEWDVAMARACGAEVSTALLADPRGFFEAMYGDQPDRWSAELAGLDRLRFTVNCLTRLRFLTEDGRLLLRYKGPLDGAPAGARPWFRVPALGYCESEGAVSLDTGCVWGGALTAVRLDRTAAPVQLPCRGALDIGAPEDAAADY